MWFDRVSAVLFVRHDKEIYEWDVGRQYGKPETVLETGMAKYVALAALGSAFALAVADDATVGSGSGSGIVEEVGICEVGGAEQGMFFPLGGDDEARLWVSPFLPCSSH
jgi:hypothetical protein